MIRKASTGCLTEPCTNNRWIAMALQSDAIALQSRRSTTIEGGDERRLVETINSVNSLSVTSGR